MSGVNLQERTASMGLQAAEFTDCWCAGFHRCHVHVIHANGRLDFESRQQAFYHLFSTKERCSFKKGYDLGSEKDL